MAADNLETRNWLKAMQVTEMTDLKIDNPVAKQIIASAIKGSELDCCDWPLETCGELALEILIALGSRGMFVVSMEQT